MTDITITLDDQIVEKAKRAAANHHANLDALIRHFVEQLAKQDEASRTRIVAEHKQSFKDFSRPMGGVDWAEREELHER